MNYGELKTSIQDYCQNSETSFVAHIPDFVRSAEDKTFLSVQMPAFWKSDSAIGTSAGVAEYQVASGSLDVLSVRINESIDNSGTTVVVFTGVWGAGDIELTGVSPNPVGVISVGDSLAFSLYGGEARVVSGLTANTVTMSSPTTGASSANPSFFVVHSATREPVGFGPSRHLLRKDYDFLLEAYPGTSSAATTGAPKYYSVSSAGESGSEPNLNIRLGPAPDGAYAVTVDYYGRTAADSITVSDSTTTWLSVTSPDTLLYGSLVEAYIYMKGEPDLIQTYTTQFQNSLMMIKNLGEGRQTSDSFTSGSKRVDSQ
jgi:hypothetical protein